jgi:hypothetical protein
MQRIFGCALDGATMPGGNRHRLMIAAFSRRTNQSCNPHKARWPNRRLPSRLAGNRQLTTILQEFLRSAALPFFYWLLTTGYWLLFSNSLTGPKVAYMSLALFSQLIENCEIHKSLSGLEKWNRHSARNADFGPIVQKSSALKTALPKDSRKPRFLDLARLDLIFKVRLQGPVLRPH